MKDKYNVNIIRYYRGIMMCDYEQLQKENHYLKKLLAKIMHDQGMNESSKILTKRSPLVEKVQLMIQLFKGRDDIYALRWESKKEGKGYTPAYALERSEERRVGKECRC